MSAKGSLFIITASSGTGKTSLVKELMAKTNDILVSISHTTRQARPGEVDGVHYHFTTVDAFKQGIDAGEFFEYAEVFGNYYGTSKSSVQEMLDAGSDVILEIDWQGALQVQDMFKSGEIDDLTMIFILPPNKSELRKRLSNRGQDTDEVIENRLAGAVTEMQQYDKFDYLIINDDFNQALSELSSIIEASRLKLVKQNTRHEKLIHTLLD